MPHNYYENLLQKYGVKAIDYSKNMEYNLVVDKDKPNKHNKCP